MDPNCSIDCCVCEHVESCQVHASNEYNRDRMLTLNTIYPGMARCIEDHDYATAFDIIRRKAKRENLSNGIAVLLIAMWVNILFVFPSQTSFFDCFLYGCLVCAAAVIGFLFFRGVVGWVLSPSFLESFYLNLSERIGRIPYLSILLWCVTIAVMSVISCLIFYLVMH